MSFPEEKIWDEINNGWSRMSFKQRFLWETMKRLPEEWQLRGYGKCWVVAIIGSTVIYYNQYEHGFNLSLWVKYGHIEQYQSLQYGLEEAVERMLKVIETGYDIGPWGGPPIPGKYPGS
ncbi:hypothetical protein DTW90_12380 [Neorhizobium sp. P12A]|uniref:hypothetical protein n=1 Tax=Neorhizobium sp. P12A TaxID=2268027 RepID=UPI0011ECFA5A|nr:hypothetical protein [Neorhizobium sp. P12A]KAA0698959.1 hypothetical protein DTW90_12380 [Neorhizobium sp. P12A]